MKKTQINLGEIEQLHRAGELVAAEQGYMDFLKQYPQDATVWHLLGMLYVSQYEWDQARQCFEQSVKLKPNDPTFSLHLANVLKAKGLIDEAILIVRDITQTYPTFAAAFNNLGTLYFAQEKWLEAVNAYQLAIMQQSWYPEAYYNLGLALNKLQRWQEAASVYRALLELEPQHLGAHFQLGCLLMRRNKHQAAIEHFSIIVQAHPTHAETQSNLATCYLKMSKFEQAKRCYLQALNTTPHDTQILFNLGVINMQQNQVQEAIKFYMRAVNVDPDLYDAHNNLGTIFLMLGKRRDAVGHFREALRLQPYNEALRHTIDILMENKSLTTSPLAYIRALFDSYADHYDAHLISTLDYQVPTYMYEMVHATIACPQSGWDIVDLGCGTGLCGTLFKPVARSLVGVDISEKMLEVAAQKNKYDELISADVVSYLTDKEARFDLIIAGDLLVYMGNLSVVFQLIHQNLKPSGLFIFNAEVNNQENYLMTNSGRFSHHQQYLEQLFKQFHFAVLQYCRITIRKHNQDKVPGHLYLLQK